MPTFRRLSYDEELPPPANPTDYVAQQLDCFTTAGLQQMAKNLDVRATGNQRRPYIASVARLLTSPDHVEILQSRLTPRQWEMLRLLPLRLGPMPIKPLIVTLHQRGVKGKDALQVVSGLLAHGCLLPQLPAAGVNHIGIDLTKPGFTGLYDHFERAPALDVWDAEHPPDGPSIAAAEAPTAVLGSALLDLQRAVFVVMAEAGRKPIKLTTAGLPYKADLTRVTKALAAAGQVAPARNATEAPPQFYFALAACAAAGLLEDRGGQLQPSGTGPEFFDSPLERQVAILLTAWAGGIYNDLAFVPTLTFGYGPTANPLLRANTYGYSYGPSADTLAIARSLVTTALVDMVQAAPTDWYAIDELTRYIFQQAPEFLYARENDYQVFYPQYYGYDVEGQRPAYAWVSRKSDGARPKPLFLDTDWPEVEGGYVRQVVGESMRWLGLTEVDQPSPGEQPTRVHLTDLGRHLLLGHPLASSGPPQVAGRVIVQPNFDVIVVDAAANWNLLAQLDAFADRQTLDRAATYRLTQAALLRGMDQGWAGDRVLETLEAATGSPLPQNVLYSLREWIARYESLTVRERAALLEADSEQQLDRWLADAQLGPLLGRRLGPTTVLVPARQRDLVVGRLRGLRTVDYATPPRNVLELRDPDRIEVAAQDLEPYLRYRLEALATPVEETTQQSVFRLTPESVARAQELGWPGSRVLDFLSLASRVPPPPDVVTRILGWSGAVPALRAETMVAVVLETERPAWAELRRVKAIGRLVHALPTPALALVAPKDLGQLRAELAARGLTLEERAITGMATGSQDRRAALRAAVQAFEDPTEVLRELSAQGLIRLTDTQGRPLF